MWSSESQTAKFEVDSELRELRSQIDLTNLDLKVTFSPINGVYFFSELSEKMEAVYDQLEDSNSFANM